MAEEAGLVTTSVLAVVAEVGKKQELINQEWELPYNFFSSGGFMVLKL